MVMGEIRQQHLQTTSMCYIATVRKKVILFLFKIHSFKCTHLKAMQRVRFGKHFELGQLANKPHRLILGLNVNLVLLSYLGQKNISTLGSIGGLH